MKRNKNSILTWVFLSLSLLSLILTFSNLVSLGNASADDDFQNKVNEFSESGKGNLFENVLEMLSNKDKEDTIQSALSYLLVPGSYINDIRNASIKDDNDNSVYNPDTMKVCDVSKNQPQNLLNHNCDLPTVGTSIAQKIISSINNYGISNGEKTSSISNWGIPSGLPDNKVPTNPDDRTGKYTALELYGYNLQFVNYKGEWDDISISTKARLLANYGFLDRVNLGVDTVFGATKAGFKAVVEKFDWNPIKYASNVINAAAGNVFWTAIDTSDYNVASTHAWTRPEFSKTLYNVYYMNSKEISEKANAEYVKQIKSILSEILKKDKYSKIRTLFAGDYGNENYPNFKFDPKLYTESSKKAVEEWKSCDEKYKKDKEEADNFNKNKKKDEANKTVSYTCGKEPELEVVPEEEQLQNWLKTDEAESFFGPMKSNYGIDCSSAKTGDEFNSCYQSAYDGKVQEEVANEKIDGQLVSDLSEDLVKSFSNSNIHLNPAAGIAHYVCANEEGKPTGKNIAEYKYVYESENNGTSEYVNKYCSPVRPSIKGGFYGTGDGESDDTRWQMFKYFQTTKRSPDIGNEFFNWVSQVVTKITITAVDFSYSNILDITDFDVLAKDILISFRDSLFFPFVNIVMAIGGLWIFLQIFRNGSMFNSIKALVTMGIVYVLGVFILMQPDKLINLIDVIPSKVDNYILEVLSSSDKTSSNELCYNTGGSNNAKRELECKIWRINIFNPWIFGQFGTNYSNLDNSKMTNKNSSLVGDASVKMGSDYTAKNWALYQLEKTKSGTITTDNNNTGYTSKGLYKLVDLQFGPNLGADSDTRYAFHWSGAEGRGGYRLASAIVSIALAIPIIGMSLAKIELSIIMSVMIIFLPFVFLFGLLPSGKNKLQAYLQKMLGILVKRAIITFFLSVLLIIITSATENSESYSSVFIFSLAMGLASKLYWKDLVNLFNVSSEATQMFINDNVGQLRQKVRDTQVLPPSLQMRVSTGLEGLKDATIGIGAGGAAGIINSIQDRKAGYKRYSSSQGINKQYRSNAILEGMINGGARGIRRATNMIHNKQRRQGFGVIDTYKNAYRAGMNNIQNEYRIQGNMLKFRMDQIGAELDSKEELAFNERLKSQKQYQNEYTKLVEMAIARKIPVNNNGEINIDAIQSRIFDAEGNINPHFKDNRYDGKFLEQMNKVIMYAGRYNESYANHLRYKNAQRVFNNIKRDNYSTDDKKVFDVLSSFDPSKKYSVLNENGEVVREEKNVNRASEEFVDRINNMNNYHLDSRREVITNNAYQNIFKYTDKLIRTKDDYIDNVLHSKDVLEAKTINDKLSLLSKDSLDYVTKDGKFSPDSIDVLTKEDELFNQSLDPFEKLSKNWDPLRNIDKEELNYINNNQPEFRSVEQVKSDIIQNKFNSEILNRNLQDIEVENLDNLNKFTAKSIIEKNKNTEFDSISYINSSDKIEEADKWKDNKIKQITENFISTNNNDIKTLVDKSRNIQKIETLNIKAVNKVQNDVKENHRQYSLNKKSNNLTIKEPIEEISKYYNSTIIVEDNNLNNGTSENILTDRNIINGHNNLKSVQKVQNDIVENNNNLNNDTSKDKKIINEDNSLKSVQKVQNDIAENTIKKSEGNIPKRKEIVKTNNKNNHSEKINSTEEILSDVPKIKDKELFNPVMDIKSSTKVKEDIINNNTDLIEQALNKKSDDNIETKINVINDIVEDKNEKVDRITEVLQNENKEKREQKKENKLIKIAKNIILNKKAEKEKREKEREELLNNITDEENSKETYSSDLFNKKRINRKRKLEFGKSREEIKQDKKQPNNSNIQKRKEKLRAVDKSRQANVESLANAIKAMKFVDLISKLNINNNKKD